MAKRWYAFLEAEVASNVRFWRIVVKVLFLATLISTMAFECGVTPLVSADAQESVQKVSPTNTPTVSLAEMEAEFLTLPAYDLEQVNAPPPSSFSVGDQIHFKVTSIDLTGKSLEQWYSEEKTHEAGWVIQLAGTQITAVPLKSGKLTLPPFSIQDFHGKRIARTQPFSVEINSAISATDPKPKEPEKVEPPLSLFFPWWVIALIALIGLGAMIATIYLLFRFGRKKLKLGVTPPQPAMSEDELALIHLQKLEDQNLLKQGKFKIYYFGISDILKNYIGSRFEFDAPECTTREMISTLSEKRSLEELELEELKEYFEKLDRVKFTDYSPQDTESYPLITQARAFIRKTRRPPQLTDPSKSSSSTMIVGSEVGVSK